MVYYTSALMQSAEQGDCSSAVGTIEGHSMYQLTSPSSTSQHGSHPSQFTNLTSSSFNTLGKVQELQVLQSTPTGPIPSATQKTQFKCEQCNMCFGSKSAHTSHMKSHSKQFQQQSINGQVGTSPSPPSSASNASSDPYQCDVCKKTFAVPARLVSQKIEKERKFKLKSLIIAPLGSSLQNAHWRAPVRVRILPQNVQCQGKPPSSSKNSYQRASVQM